MPLRTTHGCAQTVALLYNVCNCCICSIAELAGRNVDRQTLGERGKAGGGDLEGRGEEEHLWA